MTVRIPSAQVLEVSRDQGYKWLASGDLDAERLSPRNVRISTAAVQAYRESRQCKARPQMTPASH